MRVVFNRVELTNFMSFKHAVIDFNNKGYTSIIGSNSYKADNSTSNGSGKSTIFEAVAWCLTGETIRGSKDVRRIGSKGSGDCGVVLILTIDSDEYIIQRQYDPSKLFVSKNNVDISGKGIRDTAKILSDLLPDLTSELIGSVIILGQGLPQRFSNNTPSGRKEILEKLSKSDFMIDDIKSRIATRKTELTSLIQQKNNDKISITTSLSKSQQSKSEAEQSLNSLSSVDQYKDKLSFDKTKLEETELLYKQLNQNRDDIENKIDAIQEQIDKLRNERDDAVKIMESKFNEDIQKLQEEIYSNDSSIRSIKSEINRIQNIKDVCPTCGQKIPNVIKPSTLSLEKTLEELTKVLTSKKDTYNKQMLENNTRLAEEKSKWDKQINELKENLNSLKEDLNKLKMTLSSVSNNVETLKRDVFNTEKIISEYQSKIEIYQDIINKCSTEIDANNDELLYINDVIVNLQRHLEIISKFETCVKRDFRGYLLSNIISYIDKQSKIYCKDVFNTTAIDFSLDGNNISISYDGKEYECLSGGEKQKVDLIVQFSIRDMLCRYLNFSSNILVLDEISDNLDTFGCQRVFDLISTRLKDVESIYIISHHTDLMFPVDYELKIDKGIDGISRIN